MNKSRLFAATYGHLSIDVLNSSVAMILTLVAVRYGLTIAQVAFGAMLYQIMAAMSQPLFGGVTDRLRGRWVGPVGVLWTAIFFSLAAFMPTYALFITCLMVGGLGSGALHAAGMVNAAVSGGDKPTTATSVFFLGGQSGLALGPVLTGILYTVIGLWTMPLLAALTLPAVVYMLWRMNDPLPVVPVKPKPAAQSKASRGHVATAIAVTAFIIFITLRSGTAQGYATLLPKYFTELGIPAAVFGVMLGIFNLSGALGTLTGGWLGDRYNRRLIMFFSTALGAPFAYWMLHLQGPAFFAVAFVAGVLLSMPHSILLIMAQELAPGRRGLVGGLVLGFMFASGSTMAWLQGIAADRVGLYPVMATVAFFPLAASIFALLLPSTRHGSAPARKQEATAAAD